MKQPLGKVCYISGIVLSIWIGLGCLFCVKTFANDKTITIEDSWNRNVTVPVSVKRVICSGPGCLRYLTYLQAQDHIVAVDSIEAKKTQFDARPYALANPQFKTYPLFGEFRGFDNPELIVGLEQQPQVIFKTYGKMGYNPEELQRKTGIPVIVLEYGDLAGSGRKQMYQSLRIMGRVMGKVERAEALIAFFESHIKELQHRTRSISETDKISCYVGGIAKKGPHGFQSTEPLYPPFLFTNAANVAYDSSKGDANLSHADVAKEKIVEWNPERLFVDLSTIQSDPKATAIYELKNDPAYQSLKAVKSNNVYGVLPYNWYTRNFGSILADAYYIGKKLYPKQFQDIDPAIKADEIYEFLVGKPVFAQMNKAFNNTVFQRIVVETK